MNVNLHIERIVLQGNEFASVRSTDLNEALVGQINRQLMDQGMEFFDAYSESPIRIGIRPSPEYAD